MHGPTYVACKVMPSLLGYIIQFFSYALEEDIFVFTMTSRYPILMVY